MEQDPRFPIGPPQFRCEVTPEMRAQAVRDIEEAPDLLREAVAFLSPEQLDTPYREGGWTVRQVVHHLPDSHLNAYTRFRLALTEEEPTIKPYDEAAWAELSDARTAPVELSLDLLDPLHHRWVLLLNSLDEAGWKRVFVHPALGKLTLEQTALLYAWHSRHHVAHITALRERMGW